jgi:hypothetical protein
LVGVWVPRLKPRPISETGCAGVLRPTHDDEAVMDGAPEVGAVLWWGCAEFIQ